MRCPRCGMESNKLYQICVYCGAPVQQPALAAEPAGGQVSYGSSGQDAAYLYPGQTEQQQPEAERPISVEDYLRREKQVRRVPSSPKGFKAALLRLAGVGFRNLSREEKRKTVLELLVLVLIFAGGGPFLLDLLF